MTWWQLAIAYSVNLCLALAVLGLIVRRRQIHCWSFVLYALAVIGGETLVLVWQDYFWRQWFFRWKEATYTVLLMVVAVELASQAFAAFPGARRRLRLALTTIVAATCAAIMAIPSDPDLLGRYLFGWQPRLSAGAIWVVSATALLALYYRLPLHRWHRAVLVGFATYLLVFQVLLQILARRAAGVPWLSLVDTVAYLALCGWWAFSAWRPEERAPSGIAPDVLRRLRMEPV